MKNILTQLNDIKNNFGLNKHTDNLLESFEEILLSPDIEEIFNILHVSGITAKLLPEFIPCLLLDQKTDHHAYTVDKHTLKAVNFAASDERLTQNEKHILVWAMLLHDIGKPKALAAAKKKGKYYFTNHAKLGSKMVPKILKRFNFKKEEIKLLKMLVEYHEIFRYMRLYNYGKWGSRLSPENIFNIINIVSVRGFEFLLLMHQFDYQAQGEYHIDSKAYLNRRAGDLLIYYKKIKGLPYGETTSEQ